MGKVDIKTRISERRSQLPSLVNLEGRHACGGRGRRPPPARGRRRRTPSSTGGRGLGTHWSHWLGIGAIGRSSQEAPVPGRVPPSAPSQGVLILTINLTIRRVLPSAPNQGVLIRSRGGLERVEDAVWRRRFASICAVDQFRRVCTSGGDTTVPVRAPIRRLPLGLTPNRARGVAGGLCTQMRAHLCEDRFRAKREQQ